MLTLSYSLRVSISKEKSGLVRKCNHFRPIYPPSIFLSIFLSPTSRFYCPTEQKFFDRVTWLSSHGIFTFIPKLFAIPSFRPALEALFPDPSLTYTYLLRSVMLPNDIVWERARAVRSSYLEPGDVQVRVNLYHNSILLT